MSTCVDCDRTYEPRRQHGARGLCPACYGRHERRGDLADHPRRSRPADELLDDWAFLRADGHTWRQAAPRLGVTETAFAQALYRARRRGDVRGCRSVAEVAAWERKVAA